VQAVKRSSPDSLRVYWDIGRKLPSGTLLVQFALNVPLSLPPPKKFHGPFQHYPPVFPPRRHLTVQTRAVRLRYRLLCCSGKEDYCDMPAVEKQRKTTLPAIASSRLNRWTFVYTTYGVYCLTFRTRWRRCCIPRAPVKVFPAISFVKLLENLTKCQILILMKLCIFIASLITYVNRWI